MLYASDLGGGGGGKGREGKGESRVFSVGMGRTCKPTEPLCNCVAHLTVSLVVQPEPMSRFSSNSWSITDTKPAANKRNTKQYIKIYSAEEGACKWQQMLSQTRHLGSLL